MQNHAYKKILGIFGISLLMFLLGCVDTSVQPIPQKIDYKSDVNLVNLADAGGLKSADMLYRTNQKTSFGPIQYASESPENAFEEVPAGSKKLIVTYSNSKKDTFQFVTGTDLKLRLFLVGNDTLKKKIVVFKERKLWQTKDSFTDPKALQKYYPKDSALVALMNGSATQNISGFAFKVGDKDTVINFTPIKFGQIAYYRRVPAGNGTIFVLSGNDTLTTASFNFESQGRYSAVVYDKSNSLKFKVFKDD